MAYDSGDLAEGFAEASEALLSALSKMGVGNLSPAAQSAYSHLNNALSDYQEWLQELQDGKTAAY